MGKTKKTLVIHPDDRSTDFLSSIYDGINNKSVYRGGLSKKEIIQKIKTHDRIIMMGHGSPWGLFNVGGWKCKNGHIIDIDMVNVLSKKKDVFYIWCNAHEFVDQHNLKGFYTGMFISEVSEASWFHIYVRQNVVDESNNRFSVLLSESIKRPIQQTYNMVL